MNEQLRQKLEENGADVEGTLHRFMGNGALFLKFLLKFKDDQNFVLLRNSIEQKDYEEAFKAAHTLKGVSANLGLTPICDSASKLTELLRGKAASEIEIDKVLQEKEELEASYSLFIKIIEENA